MRRRLQEESVVRLLVPAEVRRVCQQLDEEASAEAAARRRAWPQQHQQQQEQLQREQQREAAAEAVVRARTATRAAKAKEAAALVAIAAAQAREAAAHAQEAAARAAELRAVRAAELPAVREAIVRAAPVRTVEVRAAELRAVREAEQQRQRDHEAALQQLEVARREQVAATEQLRLQMEQLHVPEAAAAAHPPAPVAAEVVAEAEHIVGQTLASVAGVEAVNVSMPYVRTCTGNFAAAGVLGRGGYGVVFRGFDRELQVRFAVKCLNAEAANMADPRFQREWRRSVQREIAVLQRIRHPNIIRLLGYNVPAEGADAAQQCCLLYEFGGDYSLDKHLANEALAAELTWEKRLRVITSVACALNYMHNTDEHIFHCDVKSANVVLSESGSGAVVTKLIDCGLSRLVTGNELAGVSCTHTASTTDRQLLGTAAYRCHTYCNTLEYTVQSEIYSFGLVLLEVLSGRVNTGRLIDDVEDLTADERAGNWPQGVAQELLQLGQACVARVRQRPQNMTLVVRRLNALLQQYCPAGAVAAVNQVTQERYRAAAEAWFASQDAAAQQ
jgi:chemotaxis protein histidine kinase CheA